MKLTLTRFLFKETFTLGHIESDDGSFSCFTCEDTVRPTGVKIPGETAIPAGTYKVVLDMSARFKKIMPHVLSVPGFDGIRIHKGNGPADTEGCILIGKTVNASASLPLANSDAAFGQFMIRMDKAEENKEDVTLTIVDKK